MTDWRQSAPERPEWNTGGGDHDKPYTWNDMPGFNSRFDRREQQALYYLRESVLEVRYGATYGPAWGDIFVNWPPCKRCGRTLEEHTAMGWCPSAD